MVIKKDFGMFMSMFDFETTTNASTAMARKKIQS